MMINYNFNNKYYKGVSRGVKDRPENVTVLRQRPGVDRVARILGSSEISVFDALYLHHIDPGRFVEETSVLRRMCGSIEGRSMPELVRILRSKTSPLPVSVRCALGVSSVISGRSKVCMDKYLTVDVRRAVDPSLAKCPRRVDGFSGFCSCGKDSCDNIFHIPYSKRQQRLRRRLKRLLVSAPLPDGAVEGSAAITGAACGRLLNSRLLAASSSCGDMRDVASGAISLSRCYDLCVPVLSPGGDGCPAGGSGESGGFPALTLVPPAGSRRPAEDSDRLRLRSIRERADEVILGRVQEAYSCYRCVVDARINGVAIDTDRLDYLVALFPDFARSRLREIAFSWDVSDKFGLDLLSARFYQTCISRNRFLDCYPSLKNVDLLPL